VLLFLRLLTRQSGLEKEKIINNEDNTAIKHDIPLLDFLRGWSALFVFISHAALLGGGPYILQNYLGREAINVFMFASGFLIFYQASISRTYNGFKSKQGIKKFYIRRFFRIAPLYYVVLIIVILPAYLNEPRQVVDINPYYIFDHISNFLVHATFIFGLIPEFEFSSTPLPDWSLSLEMQFYLIFPLLFILYRKAFFVSFMLSLLIMPAIYLVVKEFGASYSMPSFLPMRFNNFGSGILLAYFFLRQDTVFSEDRVKNLFIVIATIAITLFINKTLVIPAVFLFSFWLIIIKDKKTAPLKQLLNAAFSNRLSKFLAEISYSVYLIHLIIMIPFFTYVMATPNTPITSWAAYTVIVMIITFAISFLTYKYVELPGIKLGKSLIKAPTSR